MDAGNGWRDWASRSAKRAASGALPAAGVKMASGAFIAVSKKRVKFIKRSVECWAALMAREMAGAIHLRLHLAPALALLPQYLTNATGIDRFRPRLTRPVFHPQKTKPQCARRLGFAVPGDGGHLPGLAKAHVPVHSWPCFRVPLFFRRYEPDQVRRVRWPLFSQRFASQRFRTPRSSREYRRICAGPGHRANA